MINPHNIFKWAHTFGQSKKTVDFSLTYNYLSSSMYCNRFHDHTFVLEQKCWSTGMTAQIIWSHPNWPLKHEKNIIMRLRHLKLFFLSMARLYFCPRPGVLNKKHLSKLFLQGSGLQCKLTECQHLKVN